MKWLTLLTGILFGILALAGCDKNKEVTPDDNLKDHSNEIPSMKGYDLYTWTAESGELHYAILDGSNSFKHTEQLMSAQENISLLKKAVQYMPKKTYIMWNNKLFLKEMPGIPFAFPKESIIKELKDICKSKGTELTVDE